MACCTTRVARSRTASTGREQRAEVLIATVPAAALLDAHSPMRSNCVRHPSRSREPSRARSRRWCARRFAQSQVPVDASGYRRSASLRCCGCIRAARTDCPDPDLFPLIHVELRRNIAGRLSPVALAAQFGISERTFHRVFADRGTVFERHALRRRAPASARTAVTAAPGQASDCQARARLRICGCGPRLADFQERVRCHAAGLPCGRAQAGCLSRIFVAKVRAPTTPQYLPP